jgi:hypothetical protein
MDRTKTTLVATLEDKDASHFKIYHLPALA